MSQFKELYVVSFPVRDFEAAKKFYADTLGWPVFFGSDEQGWVEFGVHGSAHIALRRDPAGGGKGGPVASLTVTDADATHAWLKARGVKVDDLTVIPGMAKFATFYDPEGNQLQFVQSLY